MEAAAGDVNGLNGAAAGAHPVVVTPVPVAAPQNGQQAADGGKTLYVGNLDPSVNEDMVMAIFGQMGPVRGCKMIRESIHGGDPYCFVDFHSHQGAATALAAMNRRYISGKEIRVNWATNNGGMGGGGPGGGAHHNGYANRNAGDQFHHVFVGDLGPEVETEQLRSAFQSYGEIVDCRVVKDMTTQRSRGYGFVSFANKPDAENAIERMAGAWIGSKQVRTNWATRRPPGYGAGDRENGQNGGGGPVGGGGHPHPPRPLKYEDVFARASPANCTVYVGGLTGNGDEELLRRTFVPFGRILEVRHFRDKGYAFVRFDNKESACNAIVAVNGSDVGGGLVRCAWGKENGGNPANNHVNHMGGGGLPPPQHQPMGCGYMAAGGPPHPPPHMQQQQQQPFFPQQQPYFMYAAPMQPGYGYAPTPPYGFAPAAAFEGGQQPQAGGPQPQQVYGGAGGGPQAPQ